MEDIYGLTQEELKKALAERKYPQYHARQVFSWIYQKGAVDFAQMSDLSLQLRGYLRENFIFGALLLKKAQKSCDGTEKFLFSLPDKNLIESVIIPSEGRITACISSQAGCKFSCVFCASGKSGFKRSLTSAEIVGQVLYLKRHLKEEKLTHIVFMGTGEPLDNYDNVLKAVRIINDAQGLGIGARRITISTCGLVPGIKRLAQEGLQIELSISLHAADDKLRSQLLPVNKKYPLSQLVPACKEYIRKTNRQITFEYILIKGLNSDLPNAQKLGKIMKELKLCKVNLIAANPIRELNIEPPAKLEVLYFKNYLIKEGLNVTFRKARGEDIDAACGQLRLRHE
jgi:23S rRNA (adenine2503-C2)-methyltransferase